MSSKQHDDIISLLDNKLQCFYSLHINLYLCYDFAEQLKEVIHLWGSLERKKNVHIKDKKIRGMTFIQVLYLTHDVSENFNKWLETAYGCHE